jgi:hypothetical protein
MGSAEAVPLATVCSVSGSTKLAISITSPVIPQLPASGRTSISVAKGQEGTLALQQTASLFDDLVDRHLNDLDAGQLIFDRNHELDRVKSIGAEVIPEA